MTTYKALVDLVVAGKGVKAGSTFECSAEQASPALAFGLAEVVEGGPVSGSATKDKPKRSTTRKGS